MKTLQKTIVGLTIAALAGTMVYGTVLADEAQPAEQAVQEVQAEVPEAAQETAPEEAPGKTFVTGDGVLSIQIPRDDDNWTNIDDPNSWFAISDGTDMITVDHIASGDPLPAVELANDHYAEIYQVFYSTLDEVFVVTGRIANKDEAQTVKDAVNSFKVLKYGEVQKKEEQAQPVYAVRDVNEIRYCTEKDGVNVRSGYTTDDPKIGGFHLGDEVHVTGIVTKDGADIGWLRVDYNGQTGYTAAQFYSSVKPAPQPQPTPQPQPETPTSEELINDGRIFTGYTMDNLIDVATGQYVTVSELSQGGWANEATGEIFTQEGGGGPHLYGNRGTTLMFDSEYYAEQEEGYDPADDELINDGQIFLDNYQDLYTEEGYYVLLRELSQGGWANEQTGEVFTQEAGGGDHFYGDRGTTLVTEWYYNEYLSED